LGCDQASNIETIRTPSSGVERQAPLGRIAAANRLTAQMARGHDIHAPGHADEARSARRALLALENPATLDFDDPALEWRRLFSEILGTFLLVLAGAGAVVVGAVSGGAISRPAAVTAPGLTVLAVILFMGGVSGAHLNPAVSVAFALRGDFPWRRCLGYVLAQLVGATLSCLFLLAVLGNKGQLGATLPGGGIHDWQAMLIELALTTGLVSTILGTASTAQNVGAFSAFAVGGYIVLAGLWSSPISGASMNPARSFAPDVLRWDFTSYWVYVAGPLAGALLAVMFAYVLRGPGGDPGGVRAGQGILGLRQRKR
jgi:aquaporin Z